jgi:hypothetical protein
MGNSEQASWMDRVLEQAGRQQDGDVIAVHVGRGQNVAAGKNIHQVITQVLGQRTPGDAAEVRRALAELREQFDSIAPSLTQKQADLGADRIQTIETELQKEDSPPSGDLIRSAGDWLLQHIPQIGPAFVSLFLPESIGRVLANSGSAVIEWIRSLSSRISG